MAPKIGYHRWMAPYYWLLKSHITLFTKLQIPITISIIISVCPPFVCHNSPNHQIISCKCHFLFLNMINFIFKMVMQPDKNAMLIKGHQQYLNPSILLHFLLLQAINCCKLSKFKMARQEQAAFEAQSGQSLVHCPRLLVRTRQQICTVLFNLSITNPLFELLIPR